MNDRIVLRNTFIMHDVFHFRLLEYSRKLVHNPTNTVIYIAVCDAMKKITQYRNTFGNKVGDSIVVKTIGVGIQ
jgi:hypothetical protein